MDKVIGNIVLGQQRKDLAWNYGNASSNSYVRCIKIKPDWKFDGFINSRY